MSMPYKNGLQVPRCGPWIPVALSAPPRAGRTLLLHFAWGETAEGWLLPDGRYRTARQPIPQLSGDVTHWTLPPLGPSSPEEDVEAMRLFCERFREPRPDDSLVMELPFV